MVFSDDWGRHPSSSQHLFRYISKKNKVLWVNTIGIRSPKPDKFTLLRAGEKFRQWLHPIRRINDNLFVLDLPMLPVMGSGKLARINTKYLSHRIKEIMQKLDIDNPILFASVPNAADFIGLLNESCIIYYVTDDYSHWPAANAKIIREADRKLAANADLILACTDELAKQYENALLFPHSVDFEHFATPQLEPDKIKSIPHPRVCFFGLIYEKIDIEGLYQLARSLPEAQLVLIGPIKTDIEKLASLDNVHPLGAKPYDKLPSYLQAMDVLLLPYVDDEQIRRSGPLKIRECLAVGKPTVAIDIPDIRQYSDVVGLYQTTEQMIAQVKKYLASAKPLCQMQEKVKDDTWQDRAEQLQKLIDDILTTKIETDPPAWDEYLRKHRIKSIFYDVRWGKIVQQAYGNRVFYLSTYRKGEVVGICQFIEQKSRIFGSHLTSLPYFDVSGILADDEETLGKLIKAAKRLSQSTNSQWLELRQREKLPNSEAFSSLPMRTDKVDLKLKLPANKNALWNQFKPKVRNLIRKAEKNNLQTQIGSENLLGKFYDVYLDNMRNLGSPAHSKRFFELILEEFSQEAKIIIIEHLTKPIAGAVMIADGDNLYIPWAASLWRYKHLSANMLLYWRMLEYAIENEFEYFDFGRSTLDSGTHKFKKQWGANEYPLYWYYILSSDKKMPELRPDSKKYKFFVACWKRLPIFATRFLGPKLISKLS